MSPELSGCCGPLSCEAWWSGVLSTFRPTQDILYEDGHAYRSQRWEKIPYRLFNTILEAGKSYSSIRALKARQWEH